MIHDVTHACRLPAQHHRLPVKALAPAVHETNRQSREREGEPSPVYSSVFFRK